jgi:hypothetical protein
MKRYHRCKIETCTGYGYLTQTTLELIEKAGGNPESLIIEFLGHLSYCAKAMNNSPNPWKAACTLMAKEKIAAIYAKWLKAKDEALNTKLAEMPDDIEEMTLRFHRRNPHRNEAPDNFDPVAFMAHMPEGEE